MNPQTHKCVLIIDRSLNGGVIANIAAVLSMSIGKKLNGLIGPDIMDGNGECHHGLTQLPVPVLSATSLQLKEIRRQFLSENSGTSFLVDFNNYAQQARTYEEYTALLQSAHPEEIVYLGIALYGDKKIVNRQTKGLHLINAEIGE